MNNLFAYGTLMCEQILYTITGEAMRGIPALLSNYSRHPVAGEVYPGIIYRQGASVAGTVYLDIPEAVWARLDRFEGAMYKRENVYVQCRDRENLPVHTYVVRPQYIDCLVQVEWDYRKFLAFGKNKFQESYPGYASIDEE